jgi:hypothetical protein
MVRFYTCAKALLTCASVTLTVSGCSLARSWLGEDRADAPSSQVVRDAPVPAPAAEQPQLAERPFPTLPPPKRRAAAAAPRLIRPLVPAPVVSIAGLGEADVRRVLGEPQERAEQDGRRVWTYRGAGCRVEVTFFRDVIRDTWSALAHKVIRAEGAEGAAPCTRELRRAAG